jgi:hypothetical protein
LFLGVWLEQAEPTGLFTTLPQMLKSLIRFKMTLHEEFCHALEHQPYAKTSLHLHNRLSFKTTFHWENAMIHHPVLRDYYIPRLMYNIYFTHSKQSPTAVR